MKAIRTAALVAALTAAYSKAKDYARENPDKAAGTIDKAESFVRGKAGPKYADKVGKGSQALRGSLGLPRTSTASTTAASTTGVSTTGVSTTGTSSSVADPSEPSDGAGAGGAAAGFDPAI